MGAVRRRGADRVGRPRMRSPGRPSVARREERQRFWREIAAGRSSEEAAAAAGVSAPVGVRWFRESGGMPSVSMRPTSGRYLSFGEREEIALFRVGGAGVREIARRFGRSPSTISRELRRNAAPRSGRLEYRATTAQWHADRRARRPKPAKLARTRRCGATCRSGSRGRSPPQAVRTFLDPGRAGSAAATVAARIGAGRSRGAPSRSRTGSRSTFPMIPRCGSRTRRSTSRSMCKAGARCAASSRPACEPDARCACRVPARADAARASFSRRS